MAWRMAESIVRGEIDNRRRGRVTGRPEPVKLDLQGNCWRDLAGRRLPFTIPEPKPGDLDAFAPRQTGPTGDITASRKVKVTDMPPDQIGEHDAAKKPVPWHWGNSLHLEWFSERNGRVVIESADYVLKIIGEPAWEMTPEEEEAQRRANGEALAGSMARLVQAADARAHADTDGQEKPQTEEEAEQMQERSDRLADRIQARLAREGGGADYRRILEEVIERMRRERGEPEPTPGELERKDAWIGEANRAAEEALPNPDPEIEAALEAKHPLAERAFGLSGQVQGTAEAEGWVPDGASNEYPTAELVDATMIAAAKLAGALNGQTWPPPVDFCAGIIVRLKRARVCLDDARRATESCQEGKLITPQHLGPIVVELIDLAHEADMIIAELRARLDRGTE